MNKFCINFQVIKAAESHILCVKKERDFYRDVRAGKEKL